MQEISGAILAGGLGTRLRAVVSDRPKVLASVRGRPFLAYLLDQFGEAGIGRVVLMTGYLAAQIQDEFGDLYQTIRLAYSTESAPVGTGGALRLAFPLLFPDVPVEDNEVSRTILVMNGDSYCATDLAAFVESHRRQSAAASLVLTHVPDTSRFGKVDVAEDGRVERFLEKQGAGGAGWINAGIYLINRNLVAEIPAGRAVSIEREMFPTWSQRGNLRGFRGTGDFLDIGTPESYGAAWNFFSRRSATQRSAALNS
jgi:NDP-sugar pyrophosphorylase family protein